MPSSKYEGKSAAFQKLVFALKILLGSVPLVVFYCYARFYADGYMDGEWPMYKQVKNYINKTGLYNDFLILGDSTPKFNLNAEALSSEEYSVQNIALGGTTPVEDYYILKEYLERGNTVGTVIIAFAPVHLWHIDCVSTRTEYFHALHFLDVLDMYKNAVSFKDNQNVHNTFFTENPHIGKLLKAAIFYPPKYLPAMNNARFVRRYKGNVDAYHFYEQSKGSHFCGDRINPREAYVNQPSFSAQPMQTAYFRKVLELCREYGIRVIIEQSPLPQMCEEKILDSFEQEYFAFFNSFKSDFDLTCPSKFTYFDNNFFVDAAHMNNAGNAAWTQYIKETYIIPYINTHKPTEVLK